MFEPKQLADFVTSARGLLAFGLIWLGWSQGADGLGLAVYLMLVDWMGDVLDGFLARRSANPRHTWIGDHDLEVDITISAGLLGYMLLAGYLTWQVCLGYLVFWMVVFWHWGYARSLGMLVQAPIYLCFIYISTSQPPYRGWWMIAWVALAVIVTWPRFPEEVIPGFLASIREIKNGTTPTPNDS